MYTRPQALDEIPRAYCHLIIGRHGIPALIDTGADTTVIPELYARLLGLRYGPGATAIGVGGPVTTYVATRPLAVHIDVPVSRGTRVSWSHLGEHEIRPLIVPTPDEAPALIGRRDILVAYRFTLVERDRVFELTPL